VADLIEDGLEVLYWDEAQSALAEVTGSKNLRFEERFGLTGGNICHGDMAPDQLFVMRPLLGWARYRTPIDSLYLCGSGTHPGGGVMGAPGRNAAREILKDLRRTGLRRGKPPRPRAGGPVVPPARPMRTA